MGRDSDRAPLARARTASADVVVIGGGVTGCAVAYRLASDHDVIVLEQGEIASNASGLAGGIVSTTKFLDYDPDAARFATEFFQSFDGTGDFWFTSRNRIGFVEPEDVKRFRAQAASLAKEGFPTTFLEPEAVKERYPQFDVSDFAGAMEYGSHGWVDPYTYTSTLRDRAEARGAEFRTGVRVTDVLTDGVDVVGVETPGYTLRAPWVVCAAGWQSKYIVEEFTSLPTRPWRIDCCVLDVGLALDDSFPIGHVETGFTFRPKHNGHLRVADVGSGVEQSPEETTTGTSASTKFLQRVQRDLPDLVTAVDEIDVVNDWAGVVGLTPDTRPIVDTVPDGPDGLVVAQPSGGGVTNSPVISATVRSLVTGERVPFATEYFALDRFDSLDDQFDLDRLPSYWLKE